MDNKTKTLLMLSVLTILSVMIPTVKADKAGKVPTRMQVFSELMKNLDVKLKDAAHCQSVGLKQTDQTIGDYLSGFWVFHANTQGKNWLDISTIPTRKGYFAKVMIYRKDGEENWGWGVSFEMDDAYKVDRKSFTCVGSG